MQKKNLSTVGITILFTILEYLLITQWFGVSIWLPVTGLVFSLHFQKSNLFTNLDYSVCILYYLNLFVVYLSLLSLFQFYYECTTTLCGNMMSTGSKEAQPQTERVHPVRRISSDESQKFAENSMARIRAGQGQVELGEKFGEAAGKLRDQSVSTGLTAVASGNPVTVAVAVAEGAASMPLQSASDRMIKGGEAEIVAGKAALSQAEELHREKSEQRADLGQSLSIFKGHKS